MEQINLQKFFSKFPVIELGSIKLRDLMLSDAERYLEMMQNPEVVKYLSDEDIPSTQEQTVNEIKFWGGLFYRRMSVFWALAESDSDKFIGTIGFNSWNMINRRVEISYDLMQEYWRRGLMTKALTNAIIFAFKQMNVYRIEARTMMDNEPSKKILEKIGFKLEGILRGYRIIRGEPADICLYSLVRPDYSGFLA